VLPAQGGIICGWAAVSLICYPKNTKSMKGHDQGKTPGFITSDEVDYAQILVELR
jgi:hypothetical protein